MTGNGQDSGTIDTCIYTFMNEVTTAYPISHNNADTMSVQTHVVFNNAENLPTANTMWMKISSPPAACLGNTMGRADIHLFYCKVNE